MYNIDIVIDNSLADTLNSLGNKYRVAKEYELSEKSYLEALKV
jgi:hypothetical protein